MVENIPLLSDYKCSLKSVYRSNFCEAPIQSLQRFQILQFDHYPKEKLTSILRHLVKVCSRMSLTIDLHHVKLTRHSRFKKIRKSGLNESFDICQGELCFFCKAIIWVSKTKMS